MVSVIPLQIYVFGRHSSMCTCNICGAHASIVLTLPLHTVHPTHNLASLQMCMVDGGTIIIDEQQCAAVVDIFVVQPHPKQ